MPRFFLLFLCAGILPAQSFSLGIKGGGRLTSDLDSFFATSESRRYSVGPMATLGLPLGFRLELDALYRRDGYRTANSDILGGSYAERDRGNSWEFPILLRRTVWRGVYAGVGYAPRAIHWSGHVNAISVTSINPVIKTYSEYNLSPAWDVTHGIAASAGIEKRIGPLRVEPEIRYVGWIQPAVELYGSHGYSVVSTQNQVDLLLGIRFP